MMKMECVHERTVASSPEEVRSLIDDVFAVWPTELAPAPAPRGKGLFRAAPMMWQEYDRPGAVRAFRVVAPEGVHAEHWFDVESVDGGALMRHTIEGEAIGEFEGVWRDRIQPLHDKLMEALFDRIEAKLT
jgi:hypothetical protein